MCCYRVRALALATALACATWGCASSEPTADARWLAAASPPLTELSSTGAAVDLPAYLQEEPRPADKVDLDDPDRWRVVVSPYAWLLSLDGDVTVKGQKADVDVSFGDIVDQLSFVFEARVEVWKGDWGFTIDPTYSFLQDEDEVGPLDLDIETNVALVVVGVQRKLYEGPVSEGSDRRIKIDATAGAVATWIRTKIDVSGPTPNPELDEAWVDPVVGIRATLDLADRLKMRAAGLIGGFGIGEASDLTWGSEVLFGYQLGERSRLWGGYRVLSIDYEKGSGQKEFGFDVVIHGPTIGFSYTF